MNIAFWLFLIILLIMIWFSLNNLFEPVGNRLHEIFSETKEIIENESTEDKKGE
jgi:hypothetical protein